MKSILKINNLPFIFLSLYACVTLYAVISVYLEIGNQPLLTPLSSVLAFAFAVMHGAQRLGWKQALLLLFITFIVSLTFESVGVATGLVYGKYHYTDKLGVKFLDLVPLLIPIAWFMMSYPSFVMAARLLPNPRRVWMWRLGLAAVGALIMTAWDLVMDPMMVASGHWVWDQPGSYFNIPLQNYWGWWLTIFVSFLLFLSVGRVTPDRLHSSDTAFDRLALVSYSMAGLSNVLVCFRVGLGGPALVGLFAMLPWVFSAWQESFYQ